MALFATRVAWMNLVRMDIEALRAMTPPVDPDKLDIYEGIARIMGERLGLTKEKVIRNLVERELREE